MNTPFQYPQRSSERVATNAAWPRADAAARITFAHSALIAACCTPLAPQRLCSAQLQVSTTPESPPQPQPPSSRLSRDPLGGAPALRTRRRWHTEEGEGKPPRCWRAGPWRRGVVRMGCRRLNRTRCRSGSRHTLFTYTHGWLKHNAQRGQPHRTHHAKNAHGGRQANDDSVVRHITTRPHAYTRTYGEEQKG